MSIQNLSQFSEKHRNSLSSLGPLIIIVFIVDAIFALQLYYYDTTFTFIFLNILLFGAACIFWIIKLILYFKDRKKQKMQGFKPNGKHAQSLMYTITEEMKSFTYYLNPDNISYLVEFYIGSQIVGLMLRWCSSLGFVVVSINGYFIKKVLKEKYGMTIGDFRNKVVAKIKQYHYLIPKYTIKQDAKQQ